MVRLYPSTYTNLLKVPKNTLTKSHQNTQTDIWNLIHLVILKDLTYILPYLSQLVSGVTQNR